MDIGVVCEEALLVGVVEICAVVDGCLLGRGAAEDLWAPSVPIRDQCGGLKESRR